MKKIKERRNEMNSNKNFRILSIIILISFNILRQNLIYLSINSGENYGYSYKSNFKMDINQQLSTTKNQNTYIPGSFGFMPKIAANNLTSKINYNITANSTYSEEEIFIIEIEFIDCDNSTYIIFNNNTIIGHGYLLDIYANTHIYSQELNFGINMIEVEIYNETLTNSENLLISSRFFLTIEPEENYNEIYRFLLYCILFIIIFYIIWKIYNGLSVNKKYQSFMGIKTEPILANFLLDQLILSKREQFSIKKFITARIKYTDINSNDLELQEFLKMLKKL